MNEYKILIMNQEELMFLLNSYQVLCIGLYIFNLYLDYEKLRIFVTNELVVQSYPEDFPGGSDGKASASSAGDLGSIPGLGRSSGEGNGYPLQYSCLENLMDGKAW